MCDSVFKKPIKTVISSLPLYMFSLFKALKVVCQEINKIQRQFLCGWGQDRKKIAWVSWKTVCIDKDKGGLGIKDL